MDGIRVGGEGGEWEIELIHELDHGWARRDDDADGTYLSSFLSSRSAPTEDNVGIFDSAVAFL